MKTVFVIHNSEGTFLGKQGQWLPSVEASAVWRSPHHDVALNHMIEANAREIMLRLQIMSCPLTDKDLPLLEQATVPKKMAAIQFDEPDADAATKAVADDDDADVQGRLDIDAVADDDADLVDNPELTDSPQLADSPELVESADLPDNVDADGVDCLPETYDLFVAGAGAPASDAAVAPVSEFAQTAAADAAAIAGELETTDYSNSTER